MLLACRTDELKSGEAKRLEVPGRGPIAVFNLDGAFYAIDDTCTHGQASLAEGFVDNGVVECPFHAGTFDIRSGRALSLPAEDPVKAYPVRIEGDRVYVIPD
ncbi:MAG: bifunctional 3-phenylpropionate/cinnamic acid dioxygenase ferredoxin subunit [Stellaceae bacterium]